MSRTSQGSSKKTLVSTLHQMNLLACGRGQTHPRLVNPGILEISASTRYRPAMPRFLMGWLLGLGGTAIGLIVAALLLGDDFRIDGVVGFIISLIVFAILNAILTWLVFKFLVRNAGSIIALTGLISTFLALLITSIFTSGLSISGWGWVWGTLIVWILGMFIWLVPGPWRRHEKENERRDR